MAEKTTPGTAAAANPFLVDSATVNDALDLVREYRRGGLTGLGRTPEIEGLGTDFVLVTNETRGDRERGDVVRLGSYKLDRDKDQFRHPWLAGLSPSSSPIRFGILHHPIPDSEDEHLVPAHVSGVCVAKVDVKKTGDTHASPKSGKFHLESAKAGAVELLSNPNGTGVQLMIVRFVGPTSEKAREAVLNADLPDNGTLITATCAHTGEILENVGTYLLLPDYELKNGFHVVLERVEGRDDYWGVVNVRECVKKKASGS